MQSAYGENLLVVKFDLCATLFKIRLREDVSLDGHIIKMINILEQLNIYRVVIPHKVKTNLILQFLLNSYELFITKYNINRIKCILLELVNEIQEFYKQGKRQEEVNIASTSGTKKMQK